MRRALIESNIDNSHLKIHPPPPKRKARNHSLITYFAAGMEPNDANHRQQPNDH